MNTQYKYDAFVSYSKTDDTKTLKLVERLKEDGVRIWLDRWQIKPGDDIFELIETGLEDSRVLVCFLSKQALASDWAALERNSRLFRDPVNRDRRFIPVLIDDCVNDLPDTIRRFRYIDLRRVTKGKYAELLESCSGHCVDASNSSVNVSDCSP